MFSDPVGHYLRRMKESNDSGDTTESLAEMLVLLLSHVERHEALAYNILRIVRAHHPHRLSQIEIKLCDDHSRDSSEK